MKKCKLRIIVLVCLFIVVFSTSAFANRSVEDAITWANGQIVGNWDIEHNRSWVGWCMHFCGHVYGLSQAGFNYAIDGWNDTGTTFGSNQTNTDFNAIPRGALVFFS